NAIGANVGVEFAENELSKISVNVQDMVDLTLNVKEFEDIAVVASEYYDLTSKHSGQVTLTYTKDEEEKTLVADIDLDITNGVYVRIATVVMGETVEVVVSGSEAYLVIGEVVLAVDLKETKTLINEVMSLLGEAQVSTTMIETEQNGSLPLTLEAIGELLRTIDLNGIDPTSIAGLTWSLTGGEELSADYAVNDDLTVSVKLNDEKSFNNVVPTANASVEDTIAKVNNVRAFAMSKQYAFGFSANYYDAEMTYITLSGEARIDLVNGIYEIKGLEIGNNTLNVVYADGVVYIDYADNKLKVKVENVLDVVKVVIPIVNANLGDADAEEGSAEGSVKVDVDMAMELLSEACGEDVSAMTIEELVGKLTVELTGSLDNLGLGVILNTTNAIGANVGVEFAENELSKISVNVQDMVDLTLNVKEFEDIGVVASAYYDLTSKHSGQVTLTYTKDEEEKTLVADIDLDITNGVYVRIATVVMGETVEVVVSGSEAYVVIVEVVLAFDLKETKTLINEVMALLEMNVVEG
ncbi:MAG: hypothetical protein IJZ62_05220, partial [Clostridia bacterium]|nr:hypothetical protein [Clostridia bacterium]